MINNFRYRVAIDNDFRNVYAYLDYKSMGQMTLFEACEISSTPEGNAGIEVFLSYKRTVFVQSKKEARLELKRLISDCPIDAKKDYEQYKELLFRSLLYIICAIPRVIPYYASKEDEPHSAINCVTFKPDDYIWYHKSYALILKYLVVPR